jgi:serine/threonine-protein kinase
VSEPGLAAAPTAFGRFDIISRIGKGGMCEVFKAKIRSGTRAGELVAVKRLLPEMSQNPEAVDMFLSEADVSRLLRHPNIIEVIETGQVNDGQDESYYIAMEFVDGRDLGQILDRCRVRNILLPVDFSVYLTSKLLEALDYAHNARSRSDQPLEIVHRDVSPGNIFVSRLGEVKLGDFGIARMRSSSGEETGVWGKPYYLAPEALTGEPVTPSTDLWAAAVILYELLTDKRPFRGQTLDELSTQIQEAMPRSPRVLRPGLPDKLAQVTLTALKGSPSERYPTAGKFLEALAPFLDDRIGTPMAIASVVRGLFGG